MEGRSPSRVWPALLAGGLVLTAVVFLFNGPGVSDQPSDQVIISDADVPTGSTTSTTNVTAPLVLAARSNVEIIPGWTLVEGGLLTSRLGAATVWTGAELVVVGGTRSGGAYTDGAAFSPELRRWRRIATPPISASRTIVGLWADGEVVVFTERETAAYDPVTDRWRAIDGRPAEARHPVAAVWVGGRILVLSHRDASGESLVAVSLDSAGNWGRIADPPQAMARLAASMLGEEWIVVGGSAADERATTLAYHPHTDTWRILGELDLDPLTVTATVVRGRAVAVDSSLRTETANPAEWTAADAAPLVPVDCQPELAALCDTALLWYCGQAAVWEPNHRVWVPIMTPPSFRAEIFVGGSPVAVGSDRLMFWGGSWEGAGGPFLWEVDLSRTRTAAAAGVDLGEGWTLLPVPELGGRSDPSLRWTGSELVVWGGHGIEDEVHDGFTLDPATGQFRRLAPSPAPGRMGQIAVWTGEELVVWRGPVTAWSPETGEWRLAASAPPLAAESEGVWIGDEIVFFGGTFDPNIEERSAIYHPATDTWREMAASPLSARNRPMIAFSGEEVLVWGGSDPVPAQDGAAYDPATDSWRLLPSSPDAVRLTGPVGAWLGEELVVFGGNWVDPYRPEAPPVAGIGYTPSTETWRVIASPPIGVNRLEGVENALSAVGTGGRSMAVWFSEPYATEGSRLGFYDAATDSWTVTPAVAAPALAPEMAWTGSQVAVLTESGLLLYTPPS